MPLLRLNGDLPVVFGTAGNVMFTTFTRPFGPGEYGRYTVAETARLLATDPNHRLVSIFDPGRSVQPDAAERRLMANFHRENFDEIQRRTSTVILLSESIAFRGAFRAIGWMTRLPYQLTIAKNLDVALQIAAQTLKKDGLPSLLDSQRASLREFAQEAEAISVVDAAA